MPGDREDDFDSLARSLKSVLKTAELFGEEDFFLPRTAGKEERLAALYEQYAQCRDCPLGASRTKIVF